MGTKNTCEFVVGHLLEIRVAAGYREVADVDAMIGMIQASVARLPAGAKFNIAADWRPVQIMPPETAARAREMLSTMNPRVARSSVLTLPEHPTTNLQVIRILREAEHPARRHFTEASALLRWMSESLSAQETARLRVFLGLA